MPGLVPPIHVFKLKAPKKDVDARDKRGHDDRNASLVHETAPAQGEILIVWKIVGDDRASAVHRKHLGDIGSPGQDILRHPLNRDIPIPLHEIPFGCPYYTRDELYP